MTKSEFKRYMEDTLHIVFEDEHILDVVYDRVFDVGYDAGWEMRDSMPDPGPGAGGVG